MLYYTAARWGKLIMVDVRYACQARKKLLKIISPDSDFFISIFSLDSQKKIGNGFYSKEIKLR
jgi:hypothetical protein